MARTMRGSCFKATNLQLFSLCPTTNHDLSYNTFVTHKQFDTKYDKYTFANHHVRRHG